MQRREAAAGGGAPAGTAPAQPAAHAVSSDALLAGMAFLKVRLRQCTTARRAFTHAAHCTHDAPAHRLQPLTGRPTDSGGRTSPQPRPPSSPRPLRLITLAGGGRAAAHRRHASTGHALPHAPPKAVKFSTKARRPGPHYASPDQQPDLSSSAPPSPDSHARARASRSPPAPARLTSPRPTAYTGTFASPPEKLLRAAQNYALKGLHHGFSGSPPPEPDAFPGVAPLRPAPPAARAARQRQAAVDTLLPARAQLAMQCAAGVVEPGHEALALASAAASAASSALHGAAAGWDAASVAPPSAGLASSPARSPTRVLQQGAAGAGPGGAAAAAAAAAAQPAQQGVAWLQSAGSPRGARPPPMPAHEVRAALAARPPPPSSSGPNGRDAGATTAPLSAQPSFASFLHASSGDASGAAQRAWAGGGGGTQQHHLAPSLLLAPPSPSASSPRAAAAAAAAPFAQSGAWAVEDLLAQRLAAQDALSQQPGVLGHAGGAGLAAVAVPHDVSRRLFPPSASSKASAAPGAAGVNAASHPPPPPPQQQRVAASFEDVHVLLASIQMPDVRRAAGAAAPVAGPG